MNMKMTLSAALLASSAVLAVGCASQQHTRSVGAVVDDATVTTRVKTALLAEKDINSLEIKAETFNGTVQLSGFVDSQWQIDKAGQVARSTEGVQSVKNDLVHKPK